jgi:large subunit ribosomal protein L31
MQKEKHPNYRLVLFVDTTTGKKFICGSTVKTDKKEKFDGVEYPVFQLSVSCYSHPLYTGGNQFVDTEGRVDKFMKRYKRTAN